MIWYNPTLHELVEISLERDISTSWIILPVQFKINDQIFPLSQFAHFLFWDSNCFVNMNIESFS